MVGTEPLQIEIEREEDGRFLASVVGQFESIRSSWREWDSARETGVVRLINFPGAVSPEWSFAASEPSTFSGWRIINGQCRGRSGVFSNERLHSSYVRRGRRLRDCWHRVCRSVGLLARPLTTRVVPHQLRHTYAPKCFVPASASPP